jgi:tetratricopeptide (TPR) repeat protein
MPKNTKQKKKKNLQANNTPALSVTWEEIAHQAHQCVEEFQLEKAVDLYFRALQLNPQNCELMDTVSDILMQLGRVDEAYNLLEQSIKLAPAANGVKWMLYAQLNRGEGAVMAYNEGIKLFTKVIEEMTLKSPTNVRITSRAKVENVLTSFRLFFK